LAHFRNLSIFFRRLFRFSAGKNAGFSQSSGSIFLISRISTLSRLFVSVDIFEPSDTGTDETIFEPMIRDMIRLSVIRYGDTKRDTIFDPPDTPMLRDV
jgi:hypothetical protein